MALIIDSLLREPFITPERVASVLQRTPAEAAEALDVAADCRVDGHPLIVRFKDVWTLSPTVGPTLLSWSLKRGWRPMTGSPPRTTSLSPVRQSRAP
ncbi:MAG: hypothetical protein JO272_14570 [Pseudonocardiales bacterium]|nr:hypothetical protein [Pseudonocardiales bacterium]